VALPPGITPKTVTVGIASFFDGTLAEGTASITAPVNVVHGPSNRPIFSSTISQRFVDGVASFNLAPTDAPGLNRVDWTYKLNVVISGALVQPDPIYFILPAAGPDTIDLDGLVTVPSSAGVPISVDVLTTTDLTSPTSDASTALRAALESRAPVLAVTRDATGRIATLTQDGTTESYTRDATGRVATLTVGAVTRTVTRDATGRIQAVA
jgi:carbon monoxide dehydrogenase subunit G